MTPLPFIPHYLRNVFAILPSNECINMREMTSGENDFSKEALADRHPDGFLELFFNGGRGYENFPLLEGENHHDAYRRWVVTQNPNLDMEVA